MKIFAKVTNQGTAASETAMCEFCIRNAGLRQTLGQLTNPELEPEWVDCSGNPELRCQVCGRDASVQEVELSANR
jgi:hypothetical protein